MGDQVDQNGWLRTPKNMEDIPKKALDSMEGISGEGRVEGRKSEMKVKVDGDFGLYFGWIRRG